MDQASLDFGQPTDVMGFGQLSGEISNVDAPPPPKPRKRPRRLTPEEKAVMLEKRKKAIPEILGPLVEISVENGIYICVTCGFSTGSHYKENWRRVQIIKMHIRTKHLNAYRCHLCEKKFLSNKGYQLHLRTMHPPEDLTSLHLCNICGKSVSDIDAHLWHHKTPEEKEQVIQSGKGFALLPCDRCGKEFVGFDKLLAHQSIGNRCKGTGPRKYPVVAKTRKREFRTINRRKFHPTDRGSTIPKRACPTCGKMVIVQNLPQHEWTHKNAMEKEECIQLGTAPMRRCHVCDKLITRAGLKKHVEMHYKREGEEGANFPCEWEGCERKFWQEKYLICHRKMDHEGVTLTRKEREEFGVGSFRCPDPACSSRRFSTQFNLQDHIGRRHKSRAERPFKCDICQARFLISTDLMKHSRNHLPRAEFTLTCPQCPVLFARPNQLRLHLTIEHFVPKESKAERYRKYCEGKKIEAQKLGGRPHKCDICRLGFVLKTGLAVHLKNHRPREDFTITCPHCPGLFAASSLLRLHLTRFHSLPKETYAEKHRRYSETRKQAKKKKMVESDSELSGNDAPPSSSRRMTRSGSKRVKIELIPDNGIEIKEEDYAIRDVLSSPSEWAEDDDYPDYMSNLGSSVEIKSEDEESNGDLDDTMEGDDEIKEEMDDDIDDDARDLGHDTDTHTTTMEGDGEVKEEQNDDIDGLCDDTRDKADDPNDLDESEFLFDYERSYSPSALEMGDPLKEIEDDDESAFCITPHLSKRRKMGPSEKISTARPRKSPGSPPLKNCGFEKNTKQLKISHIAPHTFKCPTCGKSFVKEDTFLRHVECGNGCTAPSSPSTFDCETTRNAHLKCALCAHKFPDSHELAMHMVIRHETGEKKFPCIKCGKRFVLEENLRRHIDLHKIEAEKPMVCDVCDSRFEGKELLQRHVASHNAKRFSCTECEACFSGRENLERHIRLRHTGGKLAKCDQCEESFTDKAALVRHVGSVHTRGNHISPEYPRDHIKRKHEGSSDTHFLITTTLQKTHTERLFLCPHCESAFKVKKTLSRHIKKIHTSGDTTPSPHRCPHCDTGFKIVSLLDAHVRQMHVGERPFICCQDGCRSTFTQKRSLLLHLSNAHKVGGK